MNIEFISRNGAQRLILIFLGWGMEAAPLRGLCKEGYDIAAVGDYREITSPASRRALAESLAGYSEVAVVAWSFGVVAASLFLHCEGKRLPLSRRVAVNGTVCHISDTEGIPGRIFSGTLQGLSPQTLRKFKRRMFASAAEFAAFTAGENPRPLHDLREELALFERLSVGRELASEFDYAVIGEADAIFPPANQHRFWGQCGAHVESVPDMPHFPDFKRIINSYIIDKELVSRRFSASAATYRNNATVQAQVARRLWELARKEAEKAMSCGGKVIEIGVGKGVLTDLYRPRIGRAPLELWDIAEPDPQSLPDAATFRQCDAETAIRGEEDESAALILSSSTLQWFNSPKEFIAQAMRKLRSGGVLAVSAYGPGTFQEIKDAAGSGLHYPEGTELAEVAESGRGERIALRSEELRQQFDSPASLLRHLRLTGVNATGTGSQRGALALLRALERQKSAALSYRPFYLIVKKK